MRKDKIEWDDIKKNYNLRQDKECVG